MRDGWFKTTLGEICHLAKGATPTLKARPGQYPLVVTAEKRSSSDEYQFDGEAVCVPMVSSTGHGHASLKRVHYESGKFAVANIITACTAKPGAPVDMKYLWLLLDHRRDELIVPLMKGTANVSLSQKNLATVPLQLPPLVEQRRIVDLIAALDDTIEATELQGARALHAYRARGQSMSMPGDTSVELGDLLEVAKAGGTPSRKNKELFGGAIPWVKSGEVGGEVIVRTEETLTEAALASSSAWLVPAGTVLMAMYGATAAQIGRLGIDAATNQAVLALIPNGELMTPDFLYHLLRADSERLKGLATGAAQPNLSKGVILAQRYSPPTLETQEKLSAELNALLSIAESTDGVLRDLRTLRSNLLAALLLGEHEIPVSYDDLIGTHLEAA
ncbi:restriction endonuclease subunit S [Tessaracoccus oleiagri]|uniref:Type I restriction modification DNA specificity domain-containing protein n=1 Tax=Tessaracoccus oleiagri TaxID=686624 RepID=A0A1G9HJY6_9ACTN|nr:restriction endonuclease subunit S [Tessaracoccus oleiagri]SDL13290.1 Type I restriction modification DNA specificity domain-containing protein [Tessaracoccus oleiagri]